MIKNVLFASMLVAVVVQAEISELVSRLSSTNLTEQTQAQLNLLARCSNAGRPDADAERKAICLEICAALDGELPGAVASQLIRNLQRIGAAESVPALARQMANTDEHIRDDTRQALAVNPSPEAEQALMAQLNMRKARSPKETAGLIQALGERKASGASRLIRGYLGSRDDVVFVATVKALGRLDEKDGIRALSRQRAEEQGFRRIQIDAALFSTARKEVFEQLYAETDSPEVRATALLGLLLAGENGLAADAMASGDPVLQVAVIEAALQGKDPMVCDAVAVHVGSLPQYIQLRALGALEFSGNRSYAKEVESLLNASDGFLQDSASRALARIGTMNSVEALIGNGRSEARRALGRLNVEGVDQVLELAAERKGDDVRRAVAIEALSIRGRRDLIPKFFAYAAEDGKETSRAGAEAIGLIGDLSNLEQLTQLMIARGQSPVSRDILKAIVEVMRRSTRPEEAVGILVGQMDGISPRSRANILQALAQVGTKEALQPILAGCRSSDEKMQKLSFKLLGGWGDSNALNDMLELASDETISLANHVVLMRGVSRLLAAEKTWRLDVDKCIRALGACRRAEEKKLLIPTLAKVKKNPGAKAALEACLADPELEEAAQEALGKGKR